VSISLSEELIKTIDTQKGLSKRSTFMEHILLLGLDVYNERKIEKTPIKERH